MAPLITYVAGLALAGILAASGLGKVLDVKRFREILTDTYNFKAVASKYVAIATPSAELVIAALLAFPPSTSIGLGAAGTFLGGSAAIAARAWAAGAHGDCGCFGVLATTQLSGFTVVRLLGGVTASFGLLIWRFEPVVPPSGPLTTPILSWILLVVGMAFIGALSWIFTSIFRARYPSE